MNEDSHVNDVRLFMAVPDSMSLKMFFDKFPNYKMNVLISYQYVKSNLYTLFKLRENGNIRELYLDSGAFSASKGLSTITLYEYTRYLNLYHGRFDAVFNFDDEFDNPDHNMENQKSLEKELTGKKVIPVLHDKGDIFNEFKTHVEEHGYDFIAIGSNHDIPKDAWRNIEDYCDTMRREHNRNIRIHIFGRMKYDELWKHRPYSADSSTYAQAAGMGSLYLWDDENEKIITLWTNEREKNENDKAHGKEGAKKRKTLYHLNTKEEKFKMLLEDALSKLGYKREDLLNNSGPKTIFNLYFYHQLEEYLNSDRAKAKYLKERSKT